MTGNPASTGIPRTLIQIHYHDRPAGVMRVIREYARSLCRISGRAHCRNLLICAHEAIDPAGDTHLEIVDLPECQYRSIRSLRTLQRRSRSLVQRLWAIVSDPSLPRPVAVIAHNLSLGKNPALGEAYALVAARLAACPEYRFYAVVHDMALQGRTTLLRSLRRLDVQSGTLGRVLFPQVNVTTVAINGRDRTLLRRANVPALFCANSPGAHSTCRIARRVRDPLLHDAVVRLGAHDGIVIDPSRPLVLYPVRCIPRKNILEAVLAVCLVSNATLLVGGAGPRPGDRQFITRLRSFCSRFGISCIVDAQRLWELVDARGLPRGTTADTLFQMLLYRVDSVFSSAIAEGFGYALHEPWIAGCALWGRRPEGFTTAAPLDLDHLYTECPVPLDWIDRERLTRLYRQAWNVCFPSTTPFARTAEKVPLCSGGRYVDFGALDHPAQFKVLQRMLAEPVGSATRQALFRRMEKSRQAAQHCVGRNQTALQSYAGQHVFDSHFMELLSRHVRSCGQVVDVLRIERYFAHPARFRLLMDSG